MEFLHFCDPAWHEGSDRVPADFYVRPANVHMRGGFEVFENEAEHNGRATCADHLQRAVEALDTRALTIRRVNR